MLLEAYHGLGANVSETARQLSFSRNTAGRWVGRHRDDLGLQELSCRTPSCPRQTPAGVESLVVSERNQTEFEGVRPAHHLQWQHGLAFSPHTVRNVVPRHDLSQA